MRKKKKQITTKRCRKCGNINLLLFSSLNLKTCSDCDTDMKWIRLENEPKLY